MKKLSIGLLAASVVTVLAFTTPAKKEKTTYTVDTKKSTAIWTGKKVTGQHTGFILISKGTIESPGPGGITSANVEFDMKSMTNTDLTDKEWNDKLMNHLRSDDFFGVEKYPTSKIEVTKVVAKSNTEYEVTGKLTIKGITNEITFPANIKMDGKTMAVVAKVMVDRTKFDIKYGSKTFFDNIGDKAINDEFELEVNLVAKAN